MLKRPLSVALAANSGLGLSACRKSIAQDPPCPPGQLCEDPTPLLPILGPIGAGLIAIGVAVSVAIRPRQGQPPFVPDRRSVRVSALLGLSALFLLAVSTQLPVLFGWIQWGGMIGALLLGGTALRPRGSRARGLALGAAVYLVVGVAWALFISQGYVNELLGDPLQLLVLTLTWPGVMYLHFGQFLG